MICADFFETAILKFEIYALLSGKQNQGDFENSMSRMSCPILIEDGNKNEEVSAPVTNHQEIIIDNNKAKKEQTKSRISYFTIIASVLLLSMLTYAWLSPLKQAAISGPEPTATGITNRSSFA